MPRETRLDWSIFCRALGRMGRALAKQKAPAGGYAKPAQARHPLLDLILGDSAVKAAIGVVKHSEHAERGVISWANISAGSAGGFTLRIMHKGTQKRCEEALQAAIAALRRKGARCSFHDLIRHENNNGYKAILRIADPGPQLGFAR